MEEKDVYAELSSIRHLMERSSKFISLSGLSGVLAGVYALVGAGLAYMLIKDYSDSDAYAFVNDGAILSKLCTIAVIVLVLSILTAWWLTIRNAKTKQENVWNPVSKRLLVAMGIPLFTGGIFILILLAKGEYAGVASACLIFYGLSLAAASQFTYNEVKWLGICEVILGLLALIFPEQGLLFWTLGFSLLHILYGGIMHFKYER
jgi:hypothetical protein